MQLRDGTEVAPARFVLAALPILLAVWVPPVGLVWCLVARRRATGTMRRVFTVGAVIGGSLTGLAVLGIAAAVAASG